MEPGTVAAWISRQPLQDATPRHLLRQLALAMQSISRRCRRKVASYGERPRSRTDECTDCAFPKTEWSVKVDALRRESSRWRWAGGRPFAIVAQRKSTCDVIFRLAKWQAVDAGRMASDVFRRECGR